jgi:serine/threonine protein kinase
MSYTNQSNHLASAGSVPIIGGDIHEGVEVVERRSDVLWDEYKIIKRSQQPSIIRIFPHSATQEDVLEFYSKGKEELKKFELLQDEPFAYVVPLINYSFTREHGFPFVETRCTENKINLASDRICTTEQILLLAEQVSRTLAICHNAGIIHGAITYESIWYEPFHQNYILDGFGSSLLNDDQRNKLFENYSLYNFLHPEQKKGKIGFHTDVYSLGLVLLQMLAGTSWHELFYTRGKEDFQRMINRLRESIQVEGDKFSVPEWFTSMVYSCLQTGGEKISNGLELYDQFLYNQLKSTTISKKEIHTTPALQPVKQKKIFTPGVRKLRLSKPGGHKLKHLPRMLPLLFILTAIVLSLLVFSGSIKRSHPEQQLKEAKPVASIKNEESLERTSSPVTAVPQPPVMLQAKQVSAVSTPVQRNKKMVVQAPKRKSKVYREGYTLNLHTGLGTYQVISKAFFYTEPEEGTRRAANIVHWNNALLTPIKATADYIYIVFTNQFGQTSKGWLRKKDLVQVADDE